MPVPPGDLGYFDKVNYVIDAWSRPCNAPWYIYVECLKPAALEAFITFISFGLGDVARGFARPRGLNKRRSGKRKGKWSKFRPRFPEIGNMLGGALPGSEQVKGRRWSTAGKALWRIDGVAQRFLFWWLVADITIDFAFNFTSCLYETRWCEASSKGRFSWQKGLVEVAAPDIWNNMAFIDLDYQFPNPFWNTTFGDTGPNGATIAFALDYEPLFPGAPPTSYETRLIDRDTGEVWGTSGPTLPDVDDRAIAIISFPVPPNRKFRVQLFPAGGWARATDGAITGMED